MIDLKVQIYTQKLCIESMKNYNIFYHCLMGSIDYKPMKNGLLIHFSFQITLYKLILHQF